MQPAAFFSVFEITCVRAARISPQAAAVEAIFVYTPLCATKCCRAKAFPHPELEEQRNAPVKSAMPGVEIQEKDAKEKAEQTKSSQ
ncbi:MAG: hypothetical protein DMG60_20365 [Acidobacteria bacterium]|nr:MAG: hypothetical protein DMG60_20365 [Acidobacteriota bacterium]